MYKQVFPEYESKTRRLAAALKKDIFFVCFGFLLIIFSILFYAFDLGIIFPPSFEGQKIVVIPGDASIKDTARLLKGRGVIRNADDFALYMIVTGKTDAIRPGVYAFLPGASSIEVARQITGIYSQ